MLGVRCSGAEMLPQSLAQWSFIIYFILRNTNFYLKGYRFTSFLL